jgi:hypothetical protein
LRLIFQLSALKVRQRACLHLTKMLIPASKKAFSMKILYILDGGSEAILNEVEKATARIQA